MRGWHNKWAKKPVIKFHFKLFFSYFLIVIWGLNIVSENENKPQFSFSKNKPFQVKAKC